MITKTICKHGHTLSKANSYIHTRTGKPSCRTCRNNSSRKWIKANYSNPKVSNRYHSPIKGFGGNREAVIQRDGEKCVDCGMTRQEHKEKYGFDITVDHIDGKGSKTPLHLKNNEMSNLQTLCSSCHGSKDSRRREYKLKELSTLRWRRVKGVEVSKIIIKNRSELEDFAVMDYVRQVIGAGYISKGARGRMHYCWLTRFKLQEDRYLIIVVTPKYKSDTEVFTAYEETSKETT